MQEAINLFVMVIEPAIPYGVAFTIGQLMVNTFFGAAFGGQIRFR